MATTAICPSCSKQAQIIPGSARAKCRTCGEVFDTSRVSPVKVCTRCGMDVSRQKRVKDESGNYYCHPCWASRQSTVSEKPVPHADYGCSVCKQLFAADDAGYICACVSLLFCPPGFGIAGLIIGIINLSRGAVGHGITQIIMSIGFTILGMAIGAAAFS